MYGCSVLTACTAQNTQGVSAVHPIPPEFVAQQIATLLSDVRIDAVKTGMLASADIITEVARSLRDAAVGFVVVDPVMVSTSGHRLLEATAEDALRRQLVPLADILTPNLPEARVLTGLGDQASEDALLSALIELGPRSIYLKGGHSANPDEVVDLFWDGEHRHEYRSPRIDTPNTHGTGCSLAASLASNLAHGNALDKAAQLSHHWLQGAIAAGHRLDVGSGHGPIHHAHQQG